MTALNTGTAALGPGHPHLVEEVTEATIRLAGDSGDGMQLAGTQFTHTSAMFGNDISTLPDFPAEIRAPPALWPASPASRFTSAAMTSIRPAINSIRWWP